MIEQKILGKAETIKMIHDVEEELFGIKHKPKPLKKMIKWIASEVRNRLLGLLLYIPLRLFEKMNWQELSKEE